MPDNHVIDQHHQTFEGIRLLDDDGNEYWLARQLAKVLEYSEYRHFLPVIERAREACRNSNHQVEDHFEDVLEMVEIGSGAKRQIADVRFSRYACAISSFRMAIQPNLSSPMGKPTSPSRPVVRSCAIRGTLANSPRMIVAFCCAVN